MLLFIVWLFVAGDRVPVHQRLGMPIQSRIGVKPKKSDKKHSPKGSVVRVVHKDDQSDLDLRDILARKTGGKRKDQSHHNGGGEQKQESYPMNKRIKLNRKGGSGDASSSGLQASVQDSVGMSHVNKICRIVLYVLCSNIFPSLTMAHKSQESMSQMETYFNMKCSLLDTCIFYLCFAQVVQ